MHAALMQIALLTTQTPASPLAMVVATSGEVTVERTVEKGQRLRALDLLRPGDHLRIPEQGEALLLILADGHKERLKPGTEVTITDKGCVPADNVERLQDRSLTTAALGSLKELVRSGRAGVSVARGPGDDFGQGINPLSGSMVLTDRPTLVWQAIPRAREYRVQMFRDVQEVGQAPLWQTAVGEGPLEYPAWEQGLESAFRYRWRVIAIFDAKQQETIVDSSFQVATSAERSAVAEIKPLLTSCRPADWLIGALVLESYRAYGQAMPLWERLTKRFPDEAGFRDRVRAYHHRAGRSKG